MRGPQILSLVDHDVPVPVTQPAPRTVGHVDVVEAARLFPLTVDGLDTPGALHLQLGRSLRDLVPRLYSEPVQALGEPLSELPDVGALGTTDRASASGPTGTEVVRAGGHGLAEDHLRPLVVQELRVPAVLAEFVQERAPFADRLRFVDDPLAVAGLRLPYRAQRELVDVADLDARQQRLAAEGEQPRTQVRRGMNAKAYDVNGIDTRIRYDGSRTPPFTVMTSMPSKS